MPNASPATSARPGILLAELAAWVRSGCPRRQVASAGPVRLSQRRGEVRRRRAVLANGDDGH